MKKKPKKSDIFKSIRKPTAPPSKKIGEDKPLEKSLPSGRRDKHKKSDQNDE